MIPYGIISDTHNHNWSAFATESDKGLNSRLMTTLAETMRCAAEVKKLGGNTMYHCGDLFHVRGSIAPSVLNPTLDCYKAIIDSGVHIIINAGNHDLEGKSADRISSAITALEGVGCTVINTPVYGMDDVVIIPWVQDIKELKAAIEYIAPTDRASCDLLLHAPIDGVIPGIPDHGLTAGWLQGLGYRRVFSGHYHNHKDLGGGVYSIGALTHLTWGDVGTKAGYLIVSDAGVDWRSTHAPQFVDISDIEDDDEIRMAVDGNFVRISLNSPKPGEVDGIRELLTSYGAKGVQVLATANPAAATARSGASVVSKGQTLDASISSYVSTQSFKNPTKVAVLCSEILAQVRAV